ncbi:sodium channel and clathrin linker 1 isoform X2 [Anabrus simplex]|uniref:sodium channel and clathrin linker 1 isoform X2 n=1 Tax=Anabrus simplex TaxID=316456 RepID=UPI0035A2881C
MAQLLNLSSVDMPSQLAHDPVLSPLFKEYEAVIKALESQIEFYKNEHENLRLNLTTVVSENKSLAQQLKESLNAKYNRESIGSPGHRKESDLVANLQRQLSLTMQEKESAVEMWQLALSEVDSLEEELKMYQDNRHVELAHKQLDEVKHEYSMAINMLEEKLAEVKAQAAKERMHREELERELAQVAKDKQALTDRLDERNEQFEQTLKDHGIAIQKLQEYEKHEASLTEEIKELKESINELESALEKCHQRIEELVKREKSAVDKVQEALSIVDSALLEKDMAILAESRAAEENKRLNKVIADLIEDAGLKVKEEVDVVKKQFNGQIQLLLNDMKNLQVELATKTTQFEKIKKDFKVMEAELERVNRENRSKNVPNTTLLEKNLENVYNELSKVEKNNFELSNESERLLIKIQQLEESHRMELKQKLLEKQLLEEQLSANHIQLNKLSQAEITATTQAEVLAKRVETLEEELSKVSSHSVHGKRDWWNYQQRMQEHQQLIDQLNEVQLRGAQMAQELQEQLKSQVDIKNNDCEESEDELSNDNSSASVMHLCRSDAVNDTFIVPYEQ